MDVNSDLNTYVRDTIALSKIAIALAKQDDSYIDMCVNYLQKNNSEGAYIDVCNIVFSYYLGQHSIASTDNERDLVVNNMLNTFEIILNGAYLPRKCWLKILSVRLHNGNLYYCGEDVLWLIDNLCDKNCRDTENYIYRKIANYIINGDLFFVEPYTSALQKVLDKIGDTEFNTSAQPTYLN